MSDILAFITYEIAADSITFNQIVEEFAVSIEDLLNFNKVPWDY
jgi:hypothetical protein